MMNFETEYVMKIFGHLWECVEDVEAHREYVTETVRCIGEEMDEDISEWLMGFIRLDQIDWEELARPYPTLEEYNK